MYQSPASDAVSDGSNPVGRATWESDRVLGSLIAIGRTSKIFRYGNDAAAKVLNPQVPDHWAAIEASLTESVRSLGVPAPEVLDVIAVDGRPAVLFGYVEGPSMWDRMSNDPGGVAGLVSEFAEMQRFIHSVGVPDGMPGMVSRRCGKIAEIEAVTEAERKIAIDMTNALPRGAALLHGDFHPGNILLGSSGLVVIDWFDASVGHPVADVARTELLIDPDCLTDRRHLPDATDADLRTIAEAYATEMASVIDTHGDRLDRWRAITALSRLAERTDDDVERLLARWNNYRAHAAVLTGD